MATDKMQNGCHCHFIFIFQHTSQHEVLKEYDDIDVGLKMNSYTVNGLTPGEPYILLASKMRKEMLFFPLSKHKLGFNENISLLYCVSRDDLLI